jgi:hypothetical protein
MYGSEVRALSKRDGNTLPIRERKILRKISGPAKKLRMEDPHQSRVGGSAYGIRYYLSIHEDYEG